MDVLAGGHPTDQVERLKDEADLLASQFRSVVDRQFVQRLAIERDTAGRRSHHAAQNRQQCCLAATTRADDCDEVVVGNFEVAVVECSHDASATLVLLGDGLQLVHEEFLSVV